MKVRNVCITHVALKRQRIPGGICLVACKDQRIPGGWVSGEGFHPPPPSTSQEKRALCLSFFWTEIHLKLRISKIRIFWRNIRKFSRQNAQMPYN